VFWDLDDAAEPERQFAHAIEEMTRDPTNFIVSAIDLDEWLAGLPRMDRQLLVRRLDGFTLDEVARSLRVSIATVFSRSQRLGRELAGRVGVAVDRKRAKRARKTIANECQS
jgi:DNA-directed RNA polymerase specialized sigma24 family protein